MPNFVNTTGYLNDSPHKNNPFNIIKSKVITMNNMEDSIKSNFNDSINTRELLGLNKLYINKASKLSCIYKITNPKGNIYIGKTNNLYERIKNYVTSYNRRKKPQARLNNSLYKYGFKQHKIEIVEVVEDLTSLSQKEIYYIKLYNTFNTLHGMNLTLGGEGVTGRKMTENNKAKLIEANKNRIITDKERELRSKISKGRVSNRKGVKLSKATIEKIRISKIGKKASKETKKKMSDSQLKRWQNTNSTSI